MRTSQSMRPDPRDTAAYSVLVVSVDRQLLRRMTRFLSMFGYDVRQTTSQEVARRWLTLDPPDFLVLDAAHHESPKELLQAARRPSTYDGPYTLLLVGNPDERQWIDAFSSGVDDFLVRPLVFGELLARLRAGARAGEYDRRFRQNYSGDPQTNWLSPGGFQRFLVRQLAAGDGTWWACALFDLDHFGLVEREWGRETARALLDAVTQRLQELEPAPRRWALVRPGCYAAAWETEAPEAARQWAEQACRELSGRPFLIDSTELSVTASAGVSLQCGMEEERPRLWREAWHALHSAKTSGRDCVVVTGDFEEEQREWNLLATSGRLFETTMARDVMMPLVWLPTTDEPPAAACEQLRQSGLEATPVVDSKGTLVGLLTRAACDGGPRQTETWSGLLAPAPPTFELETTFDELIEHFAQNDDPLAIMVQRGRPVGWVSRDYLAALGQSPTRADFLPADEWSTDLESLAVRDLVPSL